MLTFLIEKIKYLEKKRIMKRFLSLAIIASLATSYTVPVMAIQEVNASKYETIKIEKIKPTTDKYSYINLEWWNGFNDEYLNEYIIKAVENNKDLKMATMAVEEFYQNVVSQRSAQLPQINVGFLPGVSDNI